MNPFGKRGSGFEGVKGTISNGIATVIHNK